MRFCDDPITHIVSQRVEHLGRLAHRQARPPHHRRYEPLETDAIDLKLALHDRMVGIGDRPERGGDRSDETLNLTRRDRKSGFEHAFTVRLKPRAPVLVDENIGDRRIRHRGEQLRPELPP